MDKLYVQRKALNNGVGTPEMRLFVLIAPAFLIPSGMLIYGWSLQYKVHWIVPDIGAFLFGMGGICINTVVSVYIIDVYTLYAASALAAGNSVRSIFSFGFPLFASAMYAKLGQGEWEKRGKCTRETDTRLTFARCAFFQAGATRCWPSSSPSSAGRARYCSTSTALHCGNDRRMLPGTETKPCLRPLVPITFLI
jgi:hypothetical protein